MFFLVCGMRNVDAFTTLHPYVLYSVGLVWVVVLDAVFGLIHHHHPHIMSHILSPSHRISISVAHHSSRTGGDEKEMKWDEKHEPSEKKEREVRKEY